MPRDVDHEFGVPFPGRVLPGAQWTTTGLRGVAPPFDWARVFGREAPHVVDLGCGNGRYLIASALARPDHDHLGIDVVQVALDYAAQRANRRGVTNARFVIGDAVTWMDEYFVDGSVEEVHIYHPQPYYEATDRGRRLLTPEFLARTWSVLRPRGMLVLQTDNRAYWKYIQRAVEKHFDVEDVPGPWPDAPAGRTRREIQARAKGLVVWRMVARRRDVPLAMEVPSPDFDADRPRFRKRRRK